jgi:outer membrane protein OmpA-like peptidoglycan-associated protein
LGASRSLHKVRHALAGAVAIGLCVILTEWITLARADRLVQPRAPAAGGRAHAIPLKAVAPRQLVTGEPLVVFGQVLPVRGRLLAVDSFTQPKPTGPSSRFPAFVYFDFRKATPKNAKRIRRIAAAIKARGSVAGLRIDGYADALGNRAYNLDLSLRRSCNVALELSRRLARRTPPMEIRAFGEAYPAAPNAHPGGSDDPDGRARNRRVEVMIVPNPSPTRLMCSVPDRPSR